MHVLAPGSESKTFAVAACLLIAVVTAGCGEGESLLDLRITRPDVGELSAPGDVTVELRTQRFVDLTELAIELDGEPVDASDWSLGAGLVRGTLPDVGPGRHELVASVPFRLPSGSGSMRLEDTCWFEVAELDRPELCESLNDVDCMLPYPSSRFLVPAPTPTGYRVAFPDGGLPELLNLRTAQLAPADPAPYAVLDGFSPTTQILMHFPDGVDLVASGAATLAPELGTFDLRSLEPGHPTVLLDADTGERVPHFLENDVRADPDGGRVVTFLRPARSLTPGHRYVVAVRGLVAPGGEPVEPEPSFRVLRDGRRTSILPVARRREAFEELFRILARHGVEREDLVLAFDFVVQSDAGLTEQMLAMRDAAFAWLETEDGGRFTVGEVELVNPDCVAPEPAVWKIVHGTYSVPLFLSADPFAAPAELGFLVTDADGVPVTSEDEDGNVVTTSAPYSIAIPCAAVTGGPLPTVLVGHGLFGDGRGMVDSALDPLLADFAYVSGGTDWVGLSSPDLGLFFFDGFLYNVFADFNQFPALPDRLRQGMLDALVLGRMLSDGVFNRDCEFQLDGCDGAGVIAPGDHGYVGVSLGGIMGIMYAALAPDATRLNVDVGAINFSLLLQRSTDFVDFEPLLDLVNPDPMSQALMISIVHELWVRGEGAGYATHVTADPLPGVAAKSILMTTALYDQQVANVASHVAAATLGLGSLPGSVWGGRALLPDVGPAATSGVVMYDTDGFDPDVDAHAPFIPPLANVQPERNGCNPHPLRFFIPGSLDQLLEFLDTGTISSFCAGLCDGATAEERPFGEPPCDPLG